jgi:ribonuclease HII
LQNNRNRPSLAEEQALASEGYRLVAGVDEAGRGALAGPVVAAAVIMPRHKKALWQSQVRDCKLLSPTQREKLFRPIQNVAIAVGIGMASAEIIDREGIVSATRLAMRLAIEQVSPLPDYLLIDYLRLPELSLPQKGITNGDRLCFSIACASIIAKVTRDRLMVELDQTYPGYGLANHKGYGTREHFARLRRLGPSAIHRRTFQPIKGMIGQ